MKLKSRHTLAAEAATRVLNEKSALGLNEFRAGIVYARLEALGPNPSPDAVDAVHNGLTEVGVCYECRQPQEEVVVFETTNRSQLCAHCIMKAMELINP